MDSQDFGRIIDEQVDVCFKILSVKAEEYAPVDRLSNFKIASVLQGRTVAQALAGMMAKHSVSIYDMILTGKEYPEAVWVEKITDHINYLLLLRAIVKEEGSGE